MPKILYFVSEDWFFLSHFLPMARAARCAGFEVVVATRVREGGVRIQAEGFRVVPIEMERGSIAPTKLIRAFRQALRIVRAEKPNITHCIAPEMIILGGIPAKYARGTALVLAVTGLGYVWSSNALKARILRQIMRHVVGRWLRGSRVTYLFENSDDPAEFGLSPADPDVTIVRGAGVDPKEFPTSPEPASPPVRIAVVSRMLRSKGIAEAVEAVGLARRRGVSVELDIYGAPDPASPFSISEATLKQWAQEPGITWHGRSNEIAKVWREHHVALFLTSYREGVPRTVIEAAAAGRPIIATDVVGCRDVVREGMEGLLVPPGDTEAAVQAIATLAGDPELRRRLGNAANRRFLERFTEQAVRDTITGLYNSIIARELDR